MYHNSSEIGEYEFRCQFLTEKKGTESVRLTEKIGIRQGKLRLTEKKLTEKMRLTAKKVYLNFLGNFGVYLYQTRINEFELDYNYFTFYKVRFLIFDYENNFG